MTMTMNAHEAALSSAEDRGRRLERKRIQAIVSAGVEFGMPDWASQAAFTTAMSAESARDHMKTRAKGERKRAGSASKTWGKVMERQAAENERAYGRGKPRA